MGNLRGVTNKEQTGKSKAQRSLSPACCFFSGLSLCALFLRGHSLLPQARFVSWLKAAKKLPHGISYPLGPSLEASGPARAGDGLVLC